MGLGTPVPLAVIIANPITPTSPPVEADFWTKAGVLTSFETPTNTVFNGTASAVADFAGSQGYWGLRTDTSLGFNLDMYNGGSPVDAIHVSTNGNVGIGTTNPYSRLQVTGPDTASTSVFAVVNNASTTEFSVYDTGNAVLAGTLTQSSDQRLKTNIQSLDASSSLTLIEALNPVSFNWIDDIFGGGDQLGFIAQDVQKLFPQLVSTTSPTALTPNGTLGLNYTGLIAPIVGAIKEIASELANLEQTVAGFATEFHTQELCVGSTCVTPTQFQAMVAAVGQSGTPSGQGSASAPSADTATDAPPVIQINGDNPAVVDVGDTYNDLGATITGPRQDLNLGIQTFLNGTAGSPIVVDTSEPATDTIDYVVTDSAGLTSTSTRTVLIQAPTPQASAATSTATTTSS